jgi:hypothetical protein
MRSFVVPVLAAAIVLGAVRPAAAQAEAEFVWVGAPLSEALYELAEATGLELVFALRLVEDVRVTGRYRASDDPDRALRYLLRGTGVRAERIRDGQYVLIKEPLNVSAGGETDRDAYTGTLDGRVVDAESGAALMGAHVWLVDLGLGDVVAYDGSFAVADLPTGRYVVRVSHVGYTPVRLELDVFPDSPRLPPTIRLQPETVESPDAAVVAGPEPPGVQPGMTVLGARQAAAIPYALGEADLAATLSWLPGLTRTGGASGALVVRGADPTQTRYVRDGVPLYEPWHAFGLFSAFQPEALARVRFHRGSLPAPLGGGLAAVLDVETTDALAGDTLRTLGLGAVAARAVADVPLGDATGMHIGFRRSAIGALLTPGLRAEGGAWVLDPTGGDPFRRDGRPDVTFSDAALKFSRRVGRYGHVEVGGTLGTDAVRIDLPIGAGGMDYGWRTHTASARYDGLVGQTTLVTALGYQTGHEASEVRRLRLGAIRTDQSLVERGASIDVDHFVSLAHQLRGGVQVASRDVAGAQVRTDGADDARQRVDEVAVYAMDTWRPADGWQVQPGLRVETRFVGGRTTGLDLSPRLFARWSPDEDRLVVRAGLSRQTQAVHRVRDRVAGRYALAASRWLLADGTVPLARAWQVGVGAEWAPSEPLAFSADVYGRRSHGLLEPIGWADREAGVIPEDLLGSHPAHEGRAGGVELAARYAVADWTLGFSGAVSRAEIRAEAGGPWRPSAYDRPVAFGVIAQRASGPWSAALRLDVESGLARPDGTRDAVQVRASGAVGAHASFGGLRWTALAQATARPLGPPIGNGVGEVGLPLATDARGLPGWPVVSVSARW